MPIISNRVVKKIIAAAIVFLSMNSMAQDKSWKCETHGKIRSLSMGETSEVSASYCWEGYQHWVSYPCAQTSCAALKKFRLSRETYLSLQSPQGNPDFHLCTLAGGSPRFVDFKTPEGWQPTTICRFDSDGSFASIPYWRSSSVLIE